MAKKESLRSLRSLWAKQLREANQREHDKWRKKCQKPLGRPPTQKEFDRFCAFEQLQGAREALIDLLTDEGSLQESLRLSVEYYARELV
ncbi:MAG: hypothetical protein IKI76_02885 [Selenomonadaceae bacterium]|nr:hypothetical protein [Selenomonadaceae bacterium]